MLSMSCAQGKRTKELGKLIRTGRNIFEMTERKLQGKPGGSGEFPEQGLVLTIPQSFIHTCTKAGKKIE